MTEGRPPAEPAPASSTEVAMSRHNGVETSQLIAKDIDDAADATDRERRSADATTPDTDLTADVDIPEQASEPASGKRSATKWKSATAYGLLPALALVLAVTAGYLKFLDASARDSQLAAIQSVQTAREGTVAMLSYHPDTAEKDLTAAQERLTGSFRDSYASLIHDVVIPGAKQQQISALATVAGAASVSADTSRAVVLLLVNQTINVGNGAPSNTASSVRVGLDNINGRWLISAFDPI
jgi:Mce-associated membrane protein